MYELPRCELVPLTGNQVSFRIDGVEKTRWHYGDDSRRPYFFPMNSPRGATLTRIGHPGASNHDHHRSVWFAHHSLLGIDFWSENTSSFIRQKVWFEYRDGVEECAMAVQLDWHDGHDPQPLVEQELIVRMRPLDQGEWTLDLQSTFRPLAAEIEFQQTNYGFLAIRMAKSVSSYFGGGTITGASGGSGEEALFGKSNPWLDYSGPVPGGEGSERTIEMAGITCFDHPQNGKVPAKWHVREDGWMGPSACRDEGIVTSRMQPLRLRYLLHMHSGNIDPSRAEAIYKQWTTRPFAAVRKGTRKHMQFEIVDSEA